MSDLFCGQFCHIGIRQTPIFSCLTFSVVTGGIEQTPQHKTHVWLILPLARNKTDTNFQFVNKTEGLVCGITHCPILDIRDFRRRYVRISFLKQLWYTYTLQTDSLVLCCSFQILKYLLKNLGSFILQASK